MGQIRSLLVINTLVSLLYGAIGIACVNSFRDQELTNYLSYLGIMGVAGISFQTLQAQAFLGYREEVQNLGRGRETSKGKVLIYAIIFLLISWLYRESDLVVIVSISMTGVIACARRFHNHLGELLQNNEYHRYGKVNFLLGMLIALTAIVQVVIGLNFSAFIFLILLSYLITNRFEKQVIYAKPQFQIRPFHNPKKLSIFLVFGLSTSDLLVASRILSSNESRNFYFMTLITKALIVLYLSVFYSAQKKNLRSVRTKLIFVNISLLVCYALTLNLWVLQLDSMFPISLGMFISSLIYGNILGIFLNISKENFVKVSRFNVNLIFLILWALTMLFLLTAISANLTAITYINSLSIYYFFGSIFLVKSKA